MNLKSKNFTIFIVAVFLIFFLVFCVPNFIRTLAAYDIVQYNYDYFKYPDTIKVHSGTYTDYGDDVKIFSCKISAENAFTQRIYDGFVLSYEGSTSFEQYEEYGIFGEIPDFMREKSEKSNVNILLLNFLIKMDWM